MENNYVVYRNGKGIIEKEPLSANAKTGFLTGTGRHLKKMIYIAGLAGIGIFANSCSLGYVATEPVYVENARPVRPSNLHVWVDGDWVYSRQSHSYARNAGYWDVPSRNRTYVSGRWQTGVRGQYWERGHWQNNGRQQNRNNRQLK